MRHRHAIWSHRLNLDQASEHKPVYVEWEHTPAICLYIGVMPATGEQTIPDLIYSSSDV